MSLLNSLLILFAFFFILLLCGMIWPCRIALDASLSRTRSKVFIRLSFFAGLADFQFVVEQDRRFLNLILFRRFRLQIPFKKSDSVMKEGEDTERKLSFKFQIGEIRRIKTVFQQYRIFIRDIFRRFRVHQFRLDLDFGLLNPAATGVVYGLVLPFTKLLPHPVDVRMTPHFTGFQLDGRFRAEISVSLITLIPVVGRLLFQNFRQFRKLSSSNL